VRHLPAAALADAVGGALADACRRGGAAVAASAGDAGVWLARGDERRFWAAGAGALAYVVVPHVAGAAARIVGRGGVLDVGGVQADLRATFDRVLPVAPPPPPPPPVAPVAPPLPATPAAAAPVDAVAASGDAPGGWADKGAPPALVNGGGGAAADGAATHARAAGGGSPAAAV